MINNCKRIKVNGFKPIKELDIEMRDINILVGANGVGKSNSISLFTFLENISKGKIHNYVSYNGGANSFFHFGTENTDKIEIEVSVGHYSYYVRFIHNVNDDGLFFDDEYCKYLKVNNKKITNLKTQNNQSGLAIESLYPNKNSIQYKSQKYTKKYLDQCRVYHFHDTSATAGFKKTSQLINNDYLYNNAGNIAAFLYRLKSKHNHSYQQIISAIQTVVPFFHDFYLEPNDDGDEKYILLKWFHKKPNYNNPLSANLLSDGTARFICMATLFLQPKKLRPDTIILDEPELGLHPAALEVLSDIIKTTSKETQVICSTQSVAFANYFQPEDFIVVDQDEDGASIFKRLDNRDDLHAWLEDYRMGDIWAKNLIGGRPAW